MQQLYAEDIAIRVGRLPAVLREDVTRPASFKRSDPFDATATASSFAIYGIDSLINNYNLIGTLLHEMTHTSIDMGHSQVEFLAAVAADHGITGDPNQSHFMNQTFIAWMLLRYYVDRILISDADIIATTMPNQMAYFDAQNYNMSPLVKKIRIDNQVWSARNADIGTDRAGSPIGKCANPDGTLQWEDNAYCQEFGRLYYWNEAKLACDAMGMALPTKSDWYTLRDYVGGVSVAGLYLKSPSGWKNGGNGIDDDNFTALPGGMVQQSTPTQHTHQESTGVWWANDEAGSQAFRYQMSYIRDDLPHGWRDKYRNLYSARCIAP
ncbi:MAG: FISUMP domain-containing protein [Pseudomonadales bacterium]